MKKRWHPKTTWNRCPIRGCGVRIKRNNLCCAYHWLIIANDETYFERYWQNPGFPSGQSEIRNLKSEIP
jgi:hypothetical protein